MTLTNIWLLPTESGELFGHGDGSLKLLPTESGELFGHGDGSLKLLDSNRDTLMLNFNRDLDFAVDLFMEMNIAAKVLRVYCSGECQFGDKMRKHRNVVLRSIQWLYWTPQGCTQKWF